MQSRKQRADVGRGAAARRATGAAVGAALGVAAGAGIAALGVAVRLARSVVRIDEAKERPVSVRAVRAAGSRAEIELAGVGAAIPGQYSLLFDAPERAVGAMPTARMGHARIGEVTELSAHGAWRELIAVDRGTLAPGARGRLTGWWYADPSETGGRVETIRIPGELGEAEAWVVRPRWPRRHRWAVHVHGRGADPAETFRGLAPFLRAGVTNLVIRYRNDYGAPAGVHGRYGLGLSESRDVEAAVEEAVRLGARRVTLAGWSMGGTACVVAASGDRCRGVVDGIVLDSPALDWRELLVSNAGRQRVPEAITRLGLRLIERGIIASGERDGIDFDRLDPEVLARGLEVPVLIQASRSDEVVPIAGARRFARAIPELVQLREVDGAGHVRLWNTDREGWERAVRDFVRALPAPPWRGER